MASIILTQADVIKCLVVILHILLSGIQVHLNKMSMEWFIENKSMDKHSVAKFVSHIAGKILVCCLPADVGIVLVVAVGI